MLQENQENVRFILNMKISDMQLNLNAVNIRRVHKIKICTYIEINFNQIINHLTSSDLL